MTRIKEIADRFHSLSAPVADGTYVGEINFAIEAGYVVGAGQVKVRRTSYSTDWNFGELYPQPHKFGTESHHFDGKVNDLSFITEVHHFNGADGSADFTDATAPGDFTIDANIEFAEVDWADHRYTPGVPCILLPRRYIDGEEVRIKPSILPHIGKPVMLRRAWRMDEDDKYPGEFALEPADEATRKLFREMNCTWVASGDVLPRLPKLSDVRVTKGEARYESKFPDVTVEAWGINPKEVELWKRHQTEHWAMFRKSNIVQMYLDGVELDMDKVRAAKK
jgi:hypothetical protein